MVSMSRCCGKDTAGATINTVSTLLEDKWQSYTRELLGTCAFSGVVTQAVT
jgi:hypothetical protein